VVAVVVVLVLVEVLVEVAAPTGGSATAAKGS
jgi:hypothetical protein